MISPAAIFSRVDASPFHSVRAAVGVTLAILATVSIVAAEDEVPSARIARFADDRAAAISYTFDDGLRDQYKLALPMLNEMGFKGTFFVIPGKTAETPEQGEQKQRESNVQKMWGGISWPELKEMANQGHEIASHTWSHRNVSKLSSEEVDAELGKAHDAIQTRIGRPPLTLAFPFNQSTPEVRDAALKHHAAYRTFQTSTGGKSTVDSLNAWADGLVQEKKWGILMAHAISHGYAELTDPEILRAHLIHVSSRERDIWVDTFANVARYEKERDEAKLTLTGETGSVTCVLKGGLDPQLFDVPLTLVIGAAGATSAKALRAGRELPVRIVNDTIHVVAAPDNQPITITWK